MKKLFAIALFGGLLVANCSKKENPTESNNMLPEPEVVVSDTVKSDSAKSVSAPVVAPAVKDSAVAK